MSTLELRIRNLFLAIENRDGAGTKINWSTIVIGMMAVFAIMLLAVTPSVQIEVQREKELESIRRGGDAHCLR
jgi:hypothetical protein